jgi:hypothetical protein
MRITRTEIEADQLLARYPKNPEYPHFTEDSFERKLRNCQRRSATTRLILKPDPADSLAEREWKEIIRMAKLTNRQAEVYAFRKAGWTLEDIGNWMNATKQGALNVFRQASVKIRRAHDEYPYSGLAEVYRAEVNRK